MSTAPGPRKQQINADGVKREKLTGRGHGLIAAHDFSPRAQLLFVQRPLILALESSQLQITCYACLRSQDAQVASDGSQPEDIDLKTCAGCRTVRFCNKACQKHAWIAYHKHECKIFAKLQPRILPTTVRGIMRILLQRKNGLVTDEEWEQLAGLESHQEDLSTSGGERWQDISLMSKAIQTYSGTSESLDTIVRLCCTMMVNSFTLTSPTFDPMGIVLDPLPAMMNHSCDPNAVVRFDITSSPKPKPIPKVHHGSISIHALRPISKGEEIHVTYIDATVGFERRQADLQSRYFFTCDCPTCQSGPQRTAMDEAAQSKISTAMEALATTSKSGNPENVPTLSQALSTLAKAEVQIYAYPAAQLRHQLILSLLSSQDLEAAFKQSLILVVKIDPTLYSQPHHPSRLVSKWRLFRLTQYCGAEAASGDDYERADKLYMLGCLLLDELAQTVLGPDTTTVPLGQFELMVHHALLGLKSRNDTVEWIGFADDPGHRNMLREEVNPWACGIIEEVLKQEVEGGQISRR